MGKNSQFKLIRYTKVTASFEIFKEHFDENDPGLSVMYGNSYNPLEITNYKIQNEEQTQASAILSV